MNQFLNQRVDIMYIFDDFSIINYEKNDYKY